MLEFLRRQTKPIMITLAVTIIIAFTFWGGSMKTGARGERGAGSDETAFTIYGHEYSFADKARIERNFELARNMQMFEFLQALMGASRKYMTQDQMPFDLTLNLLVLRRELERNGIHASDADAKAEFKKLRAFRNPATGEFDAAQAEAFEKTLGSYGMKTEDVYELLRDWVGLRKLQKLVSGNYVESSHLTAKFYAATYQTIKAASISFPLDDFKKTAKVGDDEIKKYYDQKKDEFKSTEKRAVSYVFLAKPRDEEKKDDKDKKPVSDEERRKRENEFSKKVNDFSLATIAKDAKFEAIAKEFKEELKTLPLFAQDAPPDMLKEESGVVTEIFRNDPATHPISDPVEGKNGYFVFSVTKVEAPKQQELKEVETKFKAGKKFDDVVKEKKLEAKALPEFSPADPPKELENVRMIAGYTEKTAAGKFTEPLTNEKGVMLVYVISKELRKRDDSAKLKEELVHGFGEYSQGAIFHAWFEKRKDEAGIDANPYLRRASIVKQG